MCADPSSVDNSHDRVHNGNGKSGDGGREHIVFFQQSDDDADGCVLKPGVDVQQSDDDADGRALKPGVDGGVERATSDKDDKQDAAIVSADDASAGEPEDSSAQADARAKAQAAAVRLALRSAVALTVLFSMTILGAFAFVALEVGGPRACFRFFTPLILFTPLPNRHVCTSICPLLRLCA